MKMLRFFLVLTLVAGGISIGVAHEPPGEVYFGVSFPSMQYPQSMVT